MEGEHESRFRLRKSSSSSMEERLPRELVAELRQTRSPSSLPRPRLASRGVWTGLTLVAMSLFLATQCLKVAESLSMGGEHSCSVFDDGTVKCWGYNDVGQLGIGDKISRGLDPSDMGDELPEVDLGADFVPAGISCGLDHSCAWSTGGKLKCWGGNAFGQLGYGDKVNRGDTLTSMGDDLHYIHLGTGYAAVYAVAANHFTCVLLSDQTIKCFGRSDWGQTGSGNATNSIGDSPNEMGDDLPTVGLVAPGANYTALSLIHI